MPEVEKKKLTPHPQPFMLVKPKPRYAPTEDSNLIIQ